MDETLDSVNEATPDGAEGMTHEECDETFVDSPCPLGPQECPIFHDVEAMRTQYDELSEASHRDP
jgi:hypothetical protein